MKLLISALSTVFLLGSLSAHAISLRRVLQIHWPTTWLSKSSPTHSNRCLAAMAQIQPRQKVAQLATHIDQFLNTKKIEELSLVQKELAKGHSFEKAVTELHIDPFWHQFFDRTTGRFDYQPVQPQKLSSDNGSQALDVIRINFEARHAQSRTMSLLANALIGLAKTSRQLILDFQSVLSKLDHVQLYISVRPSELRQAQNLVNRYPLKLRQRVRLIEIDFERSATPYNNAIWANDGSKPLMDNRLATLVQADGNRVHRPVYRHILSELSTKTGLKTVPSPFRFEGGNVLVGDRHVFVGPDVVNGVVSDIKIRRSEALTALSLEFGRPVVELGYPDHRGRLHQTNYHLDLSMTVTRHPERGQTETIFVESPVDFFLKFLDFQKSDLQNQKTFSSAVEKFIANYKKNRPFPSRTERELFLNLRETQLDQLQLQDLRLTALFEQLKRLGYQVERIPGLTQARRPLATYNSTNVVLSGPYLIGPKFGIPLLDARYRQFWASFGFELIAMAAYQHAIRQEGGINCLTECYRMGPVRSSQ